MHARIERRVVGAQTSIQRSRRRRFNIKRSKRRYHMALSSLPLPLGISLKFLKRLNSPEGTSVSSPSGCLISSDETRFPPPTLTEASPSSVACCNFTKNLNTFAFGYCPVLLTLGIFSLSSCRARGNKIYFNFWGYQLLFIISMTV